MICTIKNDDMDHHFLMIRIIKSGTIRVSKNVKEVHFSPISLRNDDCYPLEANAGDEGHRRKALFVFFNEEDHRFTKSTSLFHSGVLP